MRSCALTASSPHATANRLRIHQLMSSASGCYCGSYSPTVICKRCCRPSALNVALSTNLVCACPQVLLGPVDALQSEFEISSQVGRRLVLTTSCKRKFSVSSLQPPPLPPITPSAREAMRQFVVGVRLLVDFSRGPSALACPAHTRHNIGHP